MNAPVPGVALDAAASNPFAAAPSARCSRAAGARPVRAPRGATLRTRSWLAEAPLRMLMNNLDPEVAENPDELVVYGGIGRAARDWASFDAIVATLERLRDDESLLIQSGKPVGVFRSHPDAPRALIANSNLVGKWADWSHFDELDRKGLMMYGQMTAGSWICIGSQGIVQGTYETFVELGRQHHGGDWRGRWILTAGLGGMGGAQPLAAVLAGASCVVVECQQSRIDMRLRTRYLDAQARDIDEALRMIAAAHAEGRAISVGLLGNAAELLPQWVARGIRPDALTDQTSAHDLVNGYLPIGWSVERAFDYPGFVPECIRPLFCRGKGPFRWVALSGDPEDIYRTDAKVKALFPEARHLHAWLGAARERIAFQGLPARICWLGLGERHRAGLAFNEMVRRGELKAPIVIGRDHLDTGSVASPNRETEAMRDGTDAVADWPLLNAMLNVAGGATWVSIHHGGGVGIGYSQHSGVVIVCDGTEAADRRIERVLWNDPATGVMRHADAGYEDAIDCAREHGLDLSMIASRG